MSRKLQHILHSYKHEAFQRVKYKLDLIEQSYLDKKKHILANDTDCKWALNTPGNLVFGYRIYHPKQSSTFLSCFSFSCSSTSYLAFHSKYTNRSSANRFSLLSLEILQIAPKAPSRFHTELLNVLDCLNKT